MKYRIYTNYGDYYDIDEEGYVLATNNGLRKDANSNGRKTWQIIGAWYNAGFGNIRRIDLNVLLNIKNLRYKNGKPKYGLIDIDHETVRHHGNKDVHGISSIYPLI